METAGSDYLYSEVLHFLSLAFDVQTTPPNAAKYLEDHSLDEGLFGNGRYQRCAVESVFYWSLKLGLEDANCQGPDNILLGRHRFVPFGCGLMVNSTDVYRLPPFTSQ